MCKSIASIVQLTLAAVFFLLVPIPSFGELSETAETQEPECEAVFDSDGTADVQGPAELPGVRSALPLRTSVIGPEIIDDAIKEVSANTDVKDMEILLKKLNGAAVADGTWISKLWAWAPSLARSSFEWWQMILGEPTRWETAMTDLIGNRLAKAARRGPEILAQAIRSMRADLVDALANSIRADVDQAKALRRYKTAINNFLKHEQAPNTRLYKTIRQLVEAQKNLDLLLVDLSLTNAGKPPAHASVADVMNLEKDIIAAQKKISKLGAELRSSTTRSFNYIQDVRDSIAAKVKRNFAQYRELSRLVQEVKVTSELLSKTQNEAQAAITRFTVVNSRNEVVQNIMNTKLGGFVGDVPEGSMRPLLQVLLAYRSYLDSEEFLAAWYKEGSVETLASSTATTRQRADALHNLARRWSKIYFPRVNFARESLEIGLALSAFNARVVRFVANNNLGELWKLITTTPGAFLTQLGKLRSSGNSDGLSRNDDPAFVSGEDDADRRATRRPSASKSQLSASESEIRDATLKALDDLIVWAEPYRQTKLVSIDSIHIQKLETVVGYFTTIDALGQQLDTRFVEKMAQPKAMELVNVLREIGKRSSAEVRSCANLINRILETQRIGLNSFERRPQEVAENLATISLAALLTYNWRFVWSNAKGGIIDLYQYTEFIALFMKDTAGL